IAAATTIESNITRFSMEHLLMVPECSPTPSDLSREGPSRRRSGGRENGARPVGVDRAPDRRATS
ncbi:MAG: hypothetical protein NTU62_09310, partial [Spirochaetes bacterium]|nr:hypothetical protein [Spirochaetota bacterium]